MINEIRQSTNGNFTLGSERFKEEISKTLGRRVTLGKPGRPRKSKTLGKHEIKTTWDSKKDTGKMPGENIAGLRKSIV